MRPLKKFLSFFQKTEFTARGGYLEIWQVAYPLIIMSASHTIMQFVDRKFLAARSTLEVSAAFSAGLLYFTMFCFFLATANFTSAVVAQLFGAGQEKNCVRAAWSGAFFSLLSSLIILFVNPQIGRLIIDGSVPIPELAAMEKEYFSALAGSGVFCCMAAPFFAFFSGQGRTAPAAVINTAACVLNILLDWLLIFGCRPLGLPELGVFGAGIATTLCTMFSMICIVTYFLLQNQQRFPTRKLRQPKFEYIRKLLRYGTPAGLQVFLDTGAFTLITYTSGCISSEALGASVIALSINNIFFMPLLGFSDANAIIVGQYIGRGRTGTATATAYRAWRMALLYMTGAAVLYIGFPDMLSRIFAPLDQSGGIDFPEVMRIARFILFMVVAFNFFDATKFIFTGALRGAGDTLAVLLINSGGAWLILAPGILLLVRHFHCGIHAVWLYMAGYALCECLAILWRFRTGSWKKIKLIRQT